MGLNALNPNIEGHPPAFGMASHRVRLGTLILVGLVPPAFTFELSVSMWLEYTLNYSIGALVL